MRKKTWKILGTVLGLGLVLLLLLIVAFVYNPLEGSLADIRGLVPRNVEWFVRKTDLRDDFADFPEPVFWEELASSNSWRTLRERPTVQALDRNEQISRAVADLRRIDQQLRDSSGGFISLLGDLIGHEVILAGRLRPPELANASFCAYLRVSWKVRFGWGLLDLFGPEAFGAGVPLQERDDGTLVMTPPDGGPPLYVARHLDCLLVANDEELLAEALDLATGTSDLESFAQSAYYRDEIRGRLGEWSQVTGVQPNAVEAFVRTESLFDLTRFDDGWPDPRHPESMDQRVLASFLRLDGWRFLTSSLIFEPGRLTMLGKVGLNQTLHTDFQADFFRAEEGDRSEWLNLFLSTAPRSALAVAALRVPAGDFLQEMIRSVDPELRRTMDEQIQRTGQFDSVDALIRDLEIALLPRLGVVFQQAREIGGGIESFEPSPAPHVAWVFWIDDRFRNKVEGLYAFLERYAKSTLGFENAYDLPVLDAQGGDAAREYTNPNIPGTGEIAIMVFREFLVLSNSGPLIQDMIRARVQGGSILETRDYIEFEKELAPKLNGLVFVQGGALVNVAEDYIRFLQQHSDEPDESWMVAVRPAIEREVLRAEFPGARSVAALTSEQRDRFEEAVMAQMRERWSAERRGVIADDLATFEETIALGRMFRSMFVQFRFAPDTLQWKLGALVDYR